MAIDAVTSAIIDRITASLGNQMNQPPDQFTISLASPNGGASQADLIIFLYLMTPDPELRNVQRRRPHPSPGDPPQLFSPAVPLELRYLVTTGADGGDSGDLFRPLSRLAGAIRAVEAASPLSLPAAFQEAVWLSLLPLSSDELSRIWGLFPNENCRTSFAFRAAPVWIEGGDPAVVAAPVTVDSFSSGHLEGVRS